MLVWLVVLLAAMFGALFFVMLVYLIENLHDAGKPIFEQINAHGIDGLKTGDAVLIMLAIIVVVCLLIFLQFFKSLFDQFIKKPFDAGAEELVNKFKIWVEK